MRPPYLGDSRCRSRSATGAGTWAERDWESDKHLRQSYQALGCRDISRVDIMLSEDHTPYVLEVNTIPGMTATSLVPDAARAAGQEPQADLLVSPQRLPTHQLRQHLKRLLRPEQWND